jgi:uroporphyrinogen-III synthase
MHKRPLVIVTGEADAAHLLTRDIAAQNVRTAVLPTIRFKKLPLSFTGKQSLLRLQHYDYLIFTSPRTVTFFIQELAKQKITLPAKMPAVAAVGPTTADFCRQAGLKVHFIPNHFGANELASTLPEVSGKKILFPHSALASSEASCLLRKRGAHVTPFALYTTLPLSAKILPFSEKNPPAIILFLSPSSVAAFSKQVRRSRLRKPALEAEALCLGPTTARAAATLGFTIIKTILPYELS